MRFDPRSLDSNQHLRRRSDHRDAAHADEEHVRRRVDVAQRAVDGERIGPELGLEPLRQHHLVDVAGGDVLLGLADLLLESLAGVIGSEHDRLGGRGARHRQVPFELALEELNLRTGKLI
jgi:hypothetical protein